MRKSRKLVRSERAMVRLSPAMRKKVERAADKNTLTLSTWIMVAITEKLERDK